MKRLRVALTLLVVSLCPWSQMWAARTAPTLPGGVTIEVGKNYYLYNVGAGVFFKTSNFASNAGVSSTTGSRIELGNWGETAYTISSPDNVYNWWIGNNPGVAMTNVAATNRGFYVTATAQGYTIQRESNYNAEQYVGYNGSAIVTNLTEGNIYWLFMEPDEAALYLAKKQLYDALEAADDYEAYLAPYEAVYNNPASTPEEFIETAARLNQAVATMANYAMPEWSDYPIFLDYPQTCEMGSMSLNSGKNYLQWSFYGTPEDRTYSETVKAAVIVNQDATLAFQYGGVSGASSLTVKLDGAVVQQVNTYESSDDQRYFVEMAAGSHTIEWLMDVDMSSISSGSKTINLGNIGVENTPTITVNLLEPGSLGTEILYHVDHIKDVRKLVVKGNMNSDDWNRITMMSNLFALDLTDANVEDLPASQLSLTDHRDNMQFLHAVKLPNTLKTIGNRAFYGTNIDEMTFPASLTTIGEYAFANTRIKTAVLPDGITSIGQYAFSGNETLETAKYPAGAAEIPVYCFSACPALRSITLPEGVETIHERAFYEDNSLNTRFPASLKVIEAQAFYNTALDTVVIRENVDVRYEAFYHCNKLVYIDLPSTIYTINVSAGGYRTDLSAAELVNYCPNLEKVYLRSATVVNGNRYTSFFFGCTDEKITLYVPSYLVNQYKLDEYWYNYKIEGFSTADLTDWTISSPLVLGQRERFEGTPNLKMDANATLKINGDAPQPIGNFATHYNLSDNTFIDVSTEYLSFRNMVLSNCDNVTISGNYTHSIYTYANRWYFVSLPFDAKVADITNDVDASYAVRYYDGATRAAGETGTNWKNYAADDVIPAGTGFIFQTSKEGWFTFKAQDNDAKQNVVKNQEFVKPLTEHASATAANRGWNLVGNPFLTYYNIHKLNFTAPITTYDNSTKKYTAYSIIDDDYAITPNQAFFVQCPEEVTEITFPVDGRQLTAAIESQNGAKPFGVQASVRRLVDIELSDGNQSDKTRVVLNEQAAETYETACDASKFFSFDGDASMLYTVDAEGVQYAINERPLGNGLLPLTVVAGHRGSYTIAAPRNDVGRVVLIDHETGTQTDLSAADYTFSADAGTLAGRFELDFRAAAVTDAIAVATTPVAGDEGEVFNLQGVKVATKANLSTLPAGIYVVRTGQQTVKVTVK